MSLKETEPKEMNGLFAVPKDGDKQCLILDARRANLHFIDPPASEMPHPGLFTQLQAEGKDIYTGKLDVENFYH